MKNDSTVRIFMPLLVVLANAMPAVSQRDTATHFLEEIVVTAQRSSQSILETANSIQTVNANYLRQFGPRTTPEALMGIPGVFVQKTNHGGGSPFLRGLTGNQTLLLVDGIRLNNATFRYGPNQYLNTIDPFSIERMEAAPGTGAVQYGSDAMGGALQVITRQPLFASGKPAWNGKANARYMSGDMEKTLRAEVGYSSNKVATTVGATYRNFGDLIGGDTTGRQHHSGYKEWALDAKTKLLLKQNMVLTLANQLVQQQHVPVYHKIALENFAVNEFDPQQRMLHYARLAIAHKQPLIEKIELTALFQHTIEGRNSRKNGSNTLRRERDEVSTLGFTTTVSSRISSRWNANSGIELYHDKVHSTRSDMHTQSGAATTLRGLYPDGSTYGNYALYTLHRFTLDRFVFATGLRYNAFSIQMNDTTLGAVSITPNSMVYNGSVLYKLTNKQSLYLTINSGYRAPNIDDMGTLGIVDFRYETPAYDLAPERSLNVEVGYKLKGEKLSAAVAGYYMHLSNLITRIRVDGSMISGYPVYQKVNADKGYIRGFDAQVSYAVHPSLHLNGNVAYTYGQSITRNEPLRRIPPLFGRLLAQYRKSRWTASADLQLASAQNRLAQGDKDDNRIPAGGTPAWQTINVQAGYSFAAVRLNMGLQNVLNEDYRTHGSGINGVGRSVWLTVEVGL